MFAHICAENPLSLHQYAKEIELCVILMEIFGTAERTGRSKASDILILNQTRNILTDVTDINFIHIPFSFIHVNLFPLRRRSAL